MKGEGQLDAPGFEVGALQSVLDPRRMSTLPQGNVSALKAGDPTWAHWSIFINNNTQDFIPTLPSPIPRRPGNMEYHALGFPTCSFVPGDPVTHVLAVVITR